MEALQLRATQEAAPGTVQLGANGVFEIDPIDVSCLEVKKNAFGEYAIKRFL